MSIVIPVPDSATSPPAKERSTVKAQRCGALTADARPASAVEEPSQVVGRAAHTTAYAGRTPTVGRGTAMLTEEHFGQFKRFRARAMGERLREIIDGSAYDDMTLEGKMVKLLNAEAETRKITKLNRGAGFKIPTACVEDVVYLPGRKLNRDRVARYAGRKWVEDNEVPVIISKTGCGKSHLCQALGNAACRRLHRASYTRMADMFM